MTTTLERFIDNYVLSPMSSVEFAADFPRHYSRKWRIVHEIYGFESKAIRVADSPDELLDIFAPDNDVKTLCSILSMPHVLGVEFHMYHGIFGVDAYIATRKLDSEIARPPFVIMSEASEWHRIAPLYALRRQITIDSTPIDVWRSTMRHRGHDVRLVRKGDTFSVLAYDIADNDDDCRKPKIETHGKNPYEALASWRIFVSDRAAAEFEDDDD